MRQCYEKIALANIAIDFFNTHCDIICFSYGVTNEPKIR